MSGLVVKGWMLDVGLARFQPPTSNVQHCARLHDGLRFA